jgi:transketolase
MNELKVKSINVRENIINMTGNGGCFIGSAMSCCDIILYLYEKFLNIEIDDVNNIERDYFFLSKGHAVPALYGVLVEMGFFEKKRLHNHLLPNDDIYWHPNIKIPGVEYHSGSLGQLLSISIGVALDLKLRGMKNRVVCLMGDGELNEGSNWESFLIAAAYKLSNLIIIIDRNKIQANKKTEELIPLEPLDLKLAAFGLEVQKMDGHDFYGMHDVFTNLNFSIGKPNVIIANTTRGRDLPSIENRTDKWFCNYSAEEIKTLMNELHRDN